jgi:hypothetical protein
VIAKNKFIAGSVQNKVAKGVICGFRPVLVTFSIVADELKVNMNVNYDGLS